MDILSEMYAEKKTSAIIRNLLKKTSFSIEEIAALAEVPVDFVKQVKRKLSNKKN